MESNRPVVYTAGNRWNGPGPFEEYVGWEGASVLEWNARGTCFGDDGRGGVGISFDTLRGRECERLDARYASQFVLHAVVGKALLAGPKMFRPPAADCEPLEQVELTIPVSEYRQPFPTCVVEFPEDYATSRLLPAEVPGSVFVRPGFAVVHHSDGVLTVALVHLPVHGSEGYFAVQLGLATGTIEGQLSGHAAMVDGRAAPVPGCYLEPSQSAWFTPFVRVALNFLMLAAGNHREVGPTDPARRRTLRERIKRASKGTDKDKLEDLRTRLRRMSSLYTLIQEIPLFKRESPKAEPNPDADGTPKRPHWRKGHWRRVPVGVGGAERKPVFIGSVFVNGHLLPE